MNSVAVSLVSDLSLLIHEVLVLFVKGLLVKIFEVLIYHCMIDVF